MIMVGAGVVWCRHACWWQAHCSTATHNLPPASQTCAPPHPLVPPHPRSAPQDEWNDEVLLGGHIAISEDGPWVERGPPTITRELTIIGSCSAINSRGGAPPGAARGCLQRLRWSAGGWAGWVESGLPT